MAAAINAKKAGEPLDSSVVYPTANDGVKGVAFIEAWESEGSGVNLGEDVIEPEGPSNLQRVLVVAHSVVNRAFLASANARARSRCPVRSPGWSGCSLRPP